MEFNTDYPKQNETKKTLEEINEELQEQMEVDNPIPHEVIKALNDNKKPGMETMEFPTEIIELSSKGLCYPKSNLLSLGYIELKYMTAKEEDILTSQNLIKKGVVIDKLLQELIVTNIDYSTLLVTDKFDIMIAARVLAFGKTYDPTVNCPLPNCSHPNTLDIDLTALPNIDIDYSLLNRENRYEIELPKSKAKLEFKMLTHADEKGIEYELAGLKKMSKAMDNTAKKAMTEKEFTTRLKYMITAINGNSDQQVIRKFIDNQFLTQDVQEFKKYIRKITPGMNLKILFECEECGHETFIVLPMTTQFFWPDSEI